MNNVDFGNNDRKELLDSTQDTKCNLTMSRLKTSIVEYNLKILEDELGRTLTKREIRKHSKRIQMILQRRKDNTYDVELMKTLSYPKIKENFMSVINKDSSKGVKYYITKDIVNLQ